MENNKAIKILLLDANGQNTLAIMRHLGGKGYTIHVCGYQKIGLGMFSRYADKKFVINDPGKNEEAFIRDLTKILTEDEYTLVMPVGFKAYKACAKHQDAIRKLTSLTITTNENITLASDKRATYSYAEKLGVPVPKTFMVQSVAEVEQLSISFPCVIKAPYESGKNVVEYAYSREELVKRFTDMCARNKFTAPDLPVIQEYITGDGYGFFAFYDEGVCKRFFSHHRLREYPVTGGASVCAESFTDEALKKYGTTLLNALKWNGVAMVEFKKDNNDGQYKLMEINPKFWGSLELALTAGVEFDELLVQKSLGNPITYQEGFKNVTFQWLLNGELFHGLERPADIPAIIKTLFYSKKDLRLTDPLPALYQMAYIFIHYYKKLMK